MAIQLIDPLLNVAQPKAGLRTHFERHREAKVFVANESINACSANPEQYSHVRDRYQNCFLIFHTHPHSTNQSGEHTIADEKFSGIADIQFEGSGVHAHERKK